MSPFGSIPPVADTLTAISWTRRLVISLQPVLQELRGQMEKSYAGTSHATDDTADEQWEQDHLPESGSIYKNTGIKMRIPNFLLSRKMRLGQG